VLSTGPSNLDNAQNEFEIQLEKILKTVMNSIPEEFQDDESKHKKRRKQNLPNEGDEELEKIPFGKKQKNAIPVLFLF